MAGFAGRVVKDMHGVFVQFQPSLKDFMNSAGHGVGVVLAVFGVNVMNAFKLHINIGPLERGKVNGTATLQQRTKQVVRNNALFKVV